MLTRRHLFVCICSLLTLVIYSKSVHAATDHKSELILRVSKSKAQLTDLESKVSKESAQLQQRLTGLELKIKKLRLEASKVQRSKDESLLSYEHLKERIDQWSTQSKYQNHLLTNYLSMIGDNETLQKIQGSEVVTYENILGIAYQKLSSELVPEWHDRKVIDLNGRIEPMAVVSIGPVDIAYNDKAGQAGFVDDDQPEQPRVKSAFSEQDASAIALIKSNGNGTFYFDPSLGNAFKLQKRETSLFQLFQAGGLWAIPIVFFGFLAFVISIIKGFQLIRLPSIDTNLAENLLNASREPTSSSALVKQKVIAKLLVNVGASQKKLVDIALKSPVSGQRDDLLVAYLMEVKYRIDRYMGVIATVAAVSPLLGLLGTVSGMINTFKMMTIFGSGDPSTVSGGISEALITTELGLVVAIPSLLVSALLVRKSKSHANQLETFAIKLSKLDFQIKDSYQIKDS